MTEPPVSTAFDVQNPFLGDWLDKQSLELAGNVSQTTVDNLQDTLSEGIQAGESVPDLRGRVQGTFKDAGRTRANMIARTEANKAANGASWTQAQNSGVVKTKTWLATMDDRTRPEHLAMNGETVPVDEAFSNGSMFPDDIQCRCTLTYGIDESKITEPVEELESVEEPRPGPVERMDENLGDLHDEYLSRFDYDDFWLSEEGAEEAFEYYKTAEGYKEINGALRELAGDLGDAEYEFQDMIELMDGMFEREAADIGAEDITVFRSVEPFGDMADALQNDEIIGLEFSDAGYTSTTMDEGFAESWGDEDNILAEFKIPPPAKAIYLESLTDVGESEWLLPRDMKFRVVDAYDNQGRTSLVMEVIE